MLEGVPGVPKLLRREIVCPASADGESEVQERVRLHDASLRPRPTVAVEGTAEDLRQLHERFVPRMDARRLSGQVL